MGQIIWWVKLNRKLILKRPRSVSCGAYWRANETALQWSMCTGDDFHLDRALHRKMSAITWKFGQAREENSITRTVISGELSIEYVLMYILTCRGEEHRQKAKLNLYKRQQQCGPICHTLTYRCSCNLSSFIYHLSIALSSLYCSHFCLFLFLLVLIIHP